MRFDNKSYLAPFVEYLKKIDISDYSDEIIINLPNDRTKYYMDSNYDNVQFKVTKIASSISDKLGITPF